MEAPVLTTARLRLEPLTAADLEAIHRLWALPEVRRFLWDDEVIPLETAKRVIGESSASFRREGYGLWRLSPSGGGALAGFAGLRPSDWTDALELLYGLDPSFWGRGFATEASRAVLEHAFGVLGRERIVAATDVPNVASARVIERLGMRFVGRGALHGLDTVFYELTARSVERDAEAASR